MGLSTVRIDNSTDLEKIILKHIEKLNSIRSSPELLERQ